MSALTGIRVIEVASFVAGPFCGMLLGDLGAEVIKIESPPQGDPIRNREDDSGYGAGFASINRNKKSVFLDLHDQAQRKVLAGMVARSDVLITSVRPRSRASLGLDEASLTRSNPRLIYLSMTGHGDHSAGADLPAFDTTIQARSGLLDLLGAQAGQPMGIRVLLADQLAAVYGALGVLGALVRRGATGRGGTVRTSMLEATIAFTTLNQSIQLAHHGDRPITHLRSAGYLLVAGDGLPFAVHVPPSPETTWRRFAEAIGLPELLDDQRFATKAAREENHALIHATVNRHVGAEPRDAWLARLAKADIACAPLNGLQDVLDDPLVANLGMLTHVTGPHNKQLSMIRSAITFDGDIPSVMVRAPLAGEHTAELTEGANAAE